ncbi:MAG TPA: hypothetical protein VE172_19925 [Stackebrandtia sp.]|uniref:hypothetical protein n=1 Tax=Stackebrandtia sp. TaxID=2023065 RepID=UPI002D75215B|nr:hypothetical protein [Stackebrandtia sp.]HZE41074.1 hypothetical protein [Stackebrandtia sp.]
MFEAMLNGDASTAKRLNKAQGEVTWQDSGLLVTAAFALLAEKRFAADESRTAVKAFVAEAQQNYADSPTPIKPLVAEAVTRGVLGEESLLEEVSREDQQSTQMLLAYKIVQDAEMSATDVARVLDDAEALVDQWTS